MFENSSETNFHAHFRHTHRGNLGSGFHCVPPPHIKGPDGAKLTPVHRLAFELVASCGAAPLEAGQSDCSRLFTSAEAFRLPAEGKTVVC